MAGTVAPIKHNASKEKTKWIIVAILCGILILVIFYNITSSEKGKKDVTIRAKKVNAMDFFLAPDLVNNLRTSLSPKLKEEEEELRNPELSLPARDIFAFDPDGYNKATSREKIQIGQEDFKLQGTIIDGMHSVAFVNDEVLAIGEIFNGYTVIHISAGQAVLKKGTKEVIISRRAEIDEVF